MIKIEKGYEIETNPDLDSIAHLYFGWSIELNNNIISFEKIEEDYYQLKWTAVTDDIDYYDERAKPNEFNLECKVKLHQFENEKQYYDFIKKKSAEEYNLIDKNEVAKLKEEFEQKIEELEGSSLLSPKTKKRKLIIWFIRNAISVLLYWIFWEYEWVRRLCVVYIPLALFSLSLILGGNYILNRKIKKTRQEIEDLQDSAKNFN